MTQPSEKSLDPAARVSGLLPFTQIPHTSKLFTDFLYEFPRVAKYYSPASQDRQALAPGAALVARQPYRREELVDALRTQNQRLGASGAVLDRLEQLRAADSVAIVTGQQAGLFTGPLYTILKALSVARVAESLRRGGVKAVPVFWVASEDHDFAEVNHCKIVNEAGELVESRLANCPAPQGQPVGHIRLCAEIVHPLEQFLAALPQTPYRAEIADTLRNAYAPGVGYAEAFARVMARLLEPYGVIILDPLDERLKELAAGTYEQALGRSTEIAGLLTEQSRQLQAEGYHAQVHVEPDAVPLFVIHHGRRQALVRKGDGFYLKSNKQWFGSVAEVVAQARSNPTAFSPNVTLRPVVQDTLLPTLAYLAGPSELAYFAQIKPLYRFFDRVEPAMLARASASLIDAETRGILADYGCELTDFLEGTEALYEKVVTRVLDPGTEAVIAETKGEIGRQLDRLRATLNEVDPTIAAALDTRRRKIEYHLNNLRQKYVRARAHQDHSVRARLLAAESLLYPAQNLQEREVNIFYFIARYGFGVLDEIYQAIDPGEPYHRLIPLG